MTSEHRREAGQPTTGSAGRREATAPQAATAGAPESASSQATAPEADEPVLLLVRALNTLPDDQRDQVYAWLLSRAPAGQALLPWRLREMSGQLLALQRAGAASSTTQMTSGQQVVPVRFPVDQHAQLRSWCAEHGFSMATVIRGLVSRFLDGQLPERN